LAVLLLPANEVELVIRGVESGRGLIPGSSGEPIRPAKISAMSA